MRTLTPVIRGGPLLLAALVLLGGIPCANAGDAAPRHRYTIHGSLEAPAAKTTAASPWLSVKGRLSSPPRDVGLASGGDFVVMAKLAMSPLGCASDLIFADGFDALE
jgi:hypothetical protein